MAIVFLEPDDLSASQQARVLRVLNLAVDAAGLAATIEIPGEPDIGPKLAERLLRARAALNGQFTALTQVASVPYIGPERFTDLCVAILGLQRDQLTRLARAEGPRLPAETVETYSGSSAELLLQIDAQPQPAWLGQTLHLVVRASQHGAPLINRALTLETSLGQLSHCFGFARQSGCALQLRTGADGSARLQLDYQPYEPLTLDQDNALQLALADLDTSADTPEQIRAAFQQLAADYDDERNIYLRHALDIYSRHGQDYWKHFNATNATFEWPRETAVVRAYLHGGNNLQAVMATSVTIVRWTNWIPAWFNFLHDWLSSRAELPARLAAIKRKGLRGYTLVDNLIGEAHSFVANQKGFAAELVSQHLVSDSVTRFLSTELEDVPDDTKRMLFPSLELAAEQIRAGNRGSLELVANTRGALKADIADIAQIDAGVLAELRGIREEVNLRANGIREQLDLFAAERSQFEQDYGSFVRDSAQFNDLYGTFANNFGVFSESYASFANQYSDFGNRYATFNGQYATFNANYSTFNTNYSAFNTNYATFNNNYGTFNTNYNTFNSNYSTFNNNYATFNSNYSTFNSNYSNFNANYGTFNTNLGAFNTNYSRFNNDYATFNQNRAVINNDMAVLTANVNALQTQNVQLNNQVANMSTSLNQVRTDVTGLNQRIRLRGPGG